MDLWSYAKHRNGVFALDTGEVKIETNNGHLGLQRVVVCRNNRRKS